MKNIEVEIRSFITKERHDELVKFFNKNGKLIKEDNQETHYLNAKGDLRIQKNDYFSKLWFKTGQMHDEAREEYEIKLPVQQFADLEKIFSLMGHTAKIKWYRKRLEYSWRGATVCLDYTRGYGYIIELEKMCSSGEKAKSLKELRALMSALKIPITPKSEFDRCYRGYVKNWKKLTQA